MALQLEDRLEIQDLYARYCHAIDAGDGEGWANCFTKDGTFVPSVGSSAGRSFAGHEALAAFAANPNRRKRRHWTSNILLVERDGFVEGTCYALLIDVGGSQPEIAASFAYRDELVREAGTWKFRARRHHRDVEKGQAKP